MPQLTPGDGQDFVERYKRVWESRDPDSAVELYREDAELRLDPFEEPAKGANAIRAVWNDVAASQANVEFDAERVWAVGQTVLTSWHAAFTQRGNAERVRIRGFTTFELDDEGRIQRQKQWAQSRVVGRDATFKPEGGE
ncbi:MAG TPA: nuclear transport factor 2 family protein [Candidatus Limnocylindrales bacterium]